MNTDPFAAYVDEFRREIAYNTGRRVYLGDPPMLDGRNRCTFCGRSYEGHGMQASPFDYNLSRRLREHHRNDFGPKGYYSDEPRMDD